MFNFAQYEEEERARLADMVLILSLCGRCEGEGKRVGARGVLLEQLGREWGLRLMGLGNALPGRGEMGGERVEKGNEGAQDKTSKEAKDGVDDEDDDEDVDSSTMSSRPASIGATSTHQGSSPITDPTNLSSSPPALPAIIPADELSQFYFKTPTFLRTQNLTNLNNNINSNPPTDSNATDPADYSLPPSPGTPSRRPSRKPRSRNASQTLAEIYEDKATQTDDLVILALEAENAALLLQLQETQNTLCTTELKLRATRAQAEQWRKLYATLRETVTWFFERVEASKTVEVEGGDVLSEDEGSFVEGDGDEEPEMSEVGEEEGGGVKVDVDVGEKWDGEDGEEVASMCGEDVPESLFVAKRRKRRSARRSTLGSTTLVDIQEEREEEEEVRKDSGVVGVV